MGFFSALVVVFHGWVLCTEMEWLEEFGCEKKKKKKAGVQEEVVGKMERDRRGLFELKKGFVGVG